VFTRGESADVDCKQPARGEGADTVGLLFHARPCPPGGFGCAITIISYFPAVSSSPRATRLPSRY
jgi:hypothetical protein